MIIWHTYIPGWWFGCHFLFSHILGMSSSQLTIIDKYFSEGFKPPTRYGSVMGMIILPDLMDESRRGTSY